ncbi:MAG: hypothetical protein RBT65_14570 [Methanolobus sp.]|nr:hypothetical protein [Methanolobus sp.]
MRYLPGKKAVIIDHVGNYARFGLPDQDRQWSLDPKPPAKGEGSEMPVRQCPECFYTHATAPICPHCGFVYPIKQRTIEEKKEAYLQKVTSIVTNYKTANDCKTMAELSAYAKVHGFKPGWAYHMAKRRGLL